MAIFKKSERAARFTSKEAAAVEAVSSKLDAARTTLAEAEEALRSAALDIALADDPDAAGAALHAAVTRSRARVELLEQALVDAEAAEEQRKRRVAAEHRQAQTRAARQHMSRLTKSAAAFAASWEQCVKHFDAAMVEAAAIIKLTPDEFAGRFGHVISYRALHQAFEAEMARVGAPNPNDPHSRAGSPGTRYSLSLPAAKLATPLAEDLERRLAGLHDQLTGKVAAPAAPRNGSFAPSSAEVPAEVEEVVDPVEEPTTPRSDMGLSHLPEPALSENARAWLEAKFGKLPTPSPVEVIAAVKADLTEVQEPANV